VARKLTDAEIQAALPKVPHWRLAADRLQRDFEFGDFAEAWGFMSSVALAAEAMNHHPDWSNSWNKVTIELVTHSSDGVTERDVELAQKISQIFNG
jgi:4a-hydroxytetrahydrobiopterin dehydratase